MFTMADVPNIDIHLNYSANNTDCKAYIKRYLTTVKFDAILKISKQINRVKQNGYTKKEGDKATK
jgi:hypothetical protein